MRRFLLATSVGLLCAAGSFLLSPLQDWEHITGLAFVIAGWAMAGFVGGRYRRPR
jgi:hypothetical protein